MKTNLEIMLSDHNKKYALAMADIIILKLLSLNGGVADPNILSNQIKELSEHKFGISPMSLIGRLDVMTKCGYIRRTGMYEDTKYTVCDTEEVKQYYKQLLQKHNEANKFLSKLAATKSLSDI